MSIPIASAPFAATVVSDIAVSAAFIGYVSITANPSQQLYVATRDFITQAADTPPNRPFSGTLSKMLRLDRSIVSSDGFGRVTLSWGEIEVINSTGEYDAYVSKFAVDGRRITVKAGRPGAASYAQFRTIFDGTIENWFIEEDVLRVRVRDNAFKLDTPVQSAVYAGTGGLEGGEELRGRLKPLVFGFCRNISPPLVAAAQQVYQLSSQPIFTISAVYDQAVPIPYFRAVSTADALLSLAVPPGQYAVSLNPGFIKLGSPPVGRVTADVQGTLDIDGSGIQPDTTSVIYQLVALNANFKVSDLAMYSLGAVKSAVPSSINYYLDGSEATTLGDALATLMSAINGWAGFRLDGKLAVGVLTPPVAPAVKQYDAVDILDINREPLPDKYTPAPARFRVAWNRNWTVQTDVSPQSNGVGLARVAYLAQPYLLSESDPAATTRIRSDHPLAKDSEPVEAFFFLESAAYNEANRRLALYGGAYSLYRVRVKSHPFVLDIGDVVQVTFPRFGLGGGKLLRLVSISDMPDDDQVEFVGLG